MTLLNDEEKVAFLIELLERHIGLSTVNQTAFLRANLL